jgi:hypothetical protein
MPATARRWYRKVEEVEDVEEVEEERRMGGVSRSL